jgi:hypothetical protein
MDVGQRVRVIRALDEGKEGEIIGKHTKLVPVPILRVGGDDAPVDYYTVKLDDGHTNLYPLGWVESVNN